MKNCKRVRVALQRFVVVAEFHGVDTVFERVGLIVDKVLVGD